MVELVSVDVDDARLNRLLQLYLHEWSALIPVTMGADALYASDWLALYRDRESHGTWLFLDGDGGLLGFALVSRDPSECWHVDEFFIIAGARRRGLGRMAAEALFATRPGRWMLTVRPENPGALVFWRQVGHVLDERVEEGEDGVPRTRLSYVALSR